MGLEIMELFHVVKTRLILHPGTLVKFVRVREHVVNLMYIDEISLRSVSKTKNHCQVIYCR